MDKTNLKNYFCISRFSRSILSGNWLRDYKNTSKIDKDKLKEIANKYYDTLVEKFWGVEKWEDDVEEKYIEEVYYDYSIEDLKELIECLQKMYKKYIKGEWCIKLMLAEFIQNWILDDYEDIRIIEKIKKDKEFQKYLFKIMLEWLKELRKQKRDRLREGIVKIYKLNWKKLPEIKYEDVYDYWEKYVDEYLEKKWIEWVMEEVFE